MTRLYSYVLSCANEDGKLVVGVGGRGVGGGGGGRGREGGGLRGRTRKQNKAKAEKGVFVVLSKRGKLKTAAAKAGSLGD